MTAMIFSLTLFAGFVLGAILATHLCKRHIEKLGGLIHPDSTRIDWLESERAQVIAVEGGKAVAVVTKRAQGTDSKVLAVGYTVRETIDGAMVNNTNG